MAASPDCEPVGTIESVDEPTGTIEATDELVGRLADTALVGTLEVCGEQ